MRIYLDSYRSRRIFPEAAHRACSLIPQVGAPSGLYQEAMAAVDALDESRNAITSELNTDNDVVFTSGGTEANNLAIVGVSHANPKGKHVIVSSIDQPSVLAPAKSLSTSGFDVDFAKVDKNGVMDMDDLAGLLRKDTTLVSVQAVNHEVGAIQPLKAIRDVVRDKSDAILHTDAAHAFAKMPIDMSKLEYDLLTISSHKISGPLGAGAVILPSGLKIAPHVMGDTSYHRARGGTENIPAAAGFGEAVGIMVGQRDEVWSHTNVLRKRLISGLDHITDKLQNSPVEVPDSPVELCSVERPIGMPDLANITFNFIEGEAITLYLDMEDIAVSTGSACASWNLQANYVLVAMGRSHEEAHGSIRFSFDERNTPEEIDRTIEVIEEVVERLRSMSAFKPKQ